jgi:hypothetical protein
MCVFLLLAFRQGAVTDVGMKVATTGELGSEGCAFKSPEDTRKTVVFHCSKSCRCFPKSSRICRILFGPQMSHWKAGIAPFILCCSNNLKRTENNSVHFLGLGNVSLCSYLRLGNWHASKTRGVLSAGVLQQSGLRLPIHVPWRQLNCTWHSCVPSEDWVCHGHHVESASDSGLIA